MTRVFSQTFGVVGAILEKDGKVLLVRENQPGHPDHGKWNQPAGWIDVGEDPLEAVRREVLEETGYSLTPKRLLGVYSLVRRDIEKQLGGTPHAVKLIFTGDIGSEQQSLHKDVSEIRWFSPKEIDAMNAQTLRDADIKIMVKDYFAGKSCPLELVHHKVATSN